MKSNKVKNMVEKYLHKVHYKILICFNLLESYFAALFYCVLMCVYLQLNYKC